MWELLPDCLVYDILETNCQSQGIALGLMCPEITDFEIGEAIHQSALTSVFRARRQKDDREVIIKTLNAEYPGIRDVAEIRREFQIGEKLKKIDGVIDVLSLETHGYGNQAIIMDPFGISLAYWMEKRERSPLEIEVFLKIARKVVWTMGAIHQAGIVHKDMVPRNLLVDEDGYDIRIIDFGISCELSRERQDPNLSRRLEGSMPYISPEQTGRMNRDLDYRSDYYSLGVTFFELLTGTLPFWADNVLEWIHSHISKRNPSPRDVNSDVPEALSNIVSKLMAKNAEDRYQSSFGLLSDLERCQSDFAQSGTISFFEVGKEDLSEKFQVSQKLYGRDEEVKTLQQIFERAASGGIELCLVSGYSGVGKTSIVNEIDKPIVREKGFFLQGKFDQYQRNTPYFAIARAFRGLIRQLMSETAEQLAVWKAAMLEALGQNGQLVVDIVPELESIIGPQPEIQKLPMTEAQNRFQQVFIDFVKLYANERHPLVIFLDDLQWSDPPTLQLLRQLVTSEDLTHLMVIGAYRSNEVDDGHPFILAVHEIEKTKEIEVIELAPLEASSVSELVSDCLGAEPADCQPLTDLIFETSEGNPFFVNELLKTLYEEGALKISVDSGRWEWDLERAKGLGLSGNVVEFVLEKLKRLPERTREVLQLASCIGNTFDLRTLAMIAESSSKETNRDLQEALQSNVIVPLDGSYRYAGEVDEDEVNPFYKFQHDRVQQASNELIDPAKETAVHLSIGRILRSRVKGGKFEEQLMEIVSHLNLARNLIVDPGEKLDLAELNLRAGVKGQESSAYDPALNCLDTGISLLPNDSWDAHYDLAKSLHTEYAKCAYQTGHYNEAEASIDSMLGQLRTNTERADLLSIRTRQYATTGRMEESIDAAIQGLSTLGIRFTSRPTGLSIQRELLLVKWNLRGRRIEDVAKSNELVDPEKLIAIRLLMEIFPAAFLSGSGNLLPYLVLKGVNLSLRYGNCPEAAFAYAAYGMVLCGVFVKPALGYEYGKLAVEISEQFEDITLKARILYVYAMFVHHWSNHWSTMTPWFKKGIEAGYQSGDLLYLAYSAQDCIIWDPRNDLETACREQLKYLTIVKRCEYQDSYDSGSLFLQMLMNFRGLTDSRFSLNDATFDENARVAGMRERKFMTGIANYHIYKLEIHFAYGSYERALYHLDAQDPMIKSSMSLPQIVRFYLISFLTLAQCYDRFDVIRQRSVMRRLRRDLKQMRRWADNCPENFLHIQLLMEAELARLDGDADEAIKNYGRAIVLARKNEFFRDEAMTSEMYARYFIHSGQEKAADGYLRASYMVYSRLGAARKLRQMEEEYPEQLLARSEPALTGGDQHLRSHSSTIDANLVDIESVLKASRVISGEIVIDQLLQTVMDILLENTGGQCGYFVIRNAESVTVVAESFSEKSREGEVQSELPFVVDNTNPVLPLSILNFVLRTKEHVVLDNASESNRFLKDDYIIREKPKSVICLPIHRQPDFEGAIYMENNLTVGAFTEARLEVMKMLAAQAAISIENAQLYDNLETKVRERTHELAETLDNLKLTQSHLVQSEKMAGLGTLVSGVAHEINNPTNFVNLGAASLEEDLNEFKALLFEMIGDDNDPEIVVEFKKKFHRFFLALQNINEGTLRIRTIVGDLRTFSRLDEAEQKTVPLVENLESTLRLVRSQYHDNIEFKCEFNANPEIECLPAQLNQVFMNLMVNACQAILAKDSSKKSAELPTREGAIIYGTVLLRTELVTNSNEVMVLFKDDGVGMSEEVKNRIFEPFYTTKEVGEGTGMGMSISYQIIEKHGGRFEIESTEGKGSAIQVFLPLEF